MLIREKYDKWLQNSELDDELRTELESIKNDENEIAERFSKGMTFGTGGLRSVIRAGLDGMNIYTVRQATQGLADLISEMGENAKKNGVAIAFDSRIKSDMFAKEAASVLAANGITAYIFDSLRPTPELSFTVRFLNAAAGIVITASHNPAKYNGYKVYWSDGGQIPPKEADTVYSYIKKIDIFSAKTTNFDKAVKDEKIKIIGKEVDAAYYEAVMALSVNKDAWKNTDLSVVYTPFHGAGNIPVRTVLTRMGLENLTVVKEQELPDGRFPTVKSPNPENSESFELAVDHAVQHKSDIIIGTDPDSDRVGVLVRSKEGKYVVMTGNQIGVLLTNYILSNNVTKNDAVVSTIVSSRLIKAVCEKKGATYFDVLTGFKFIGEKIHEFEQTSQYNFVFGAEESYGYLAGTYARDKDAVTASMLICEMAAFYKGQGVTLAEKLDELFLEYGYYQEELISIEKNGIQGKIEIEQFMKKIRNCDNKKYNIKDKIDYLKGIDNLPKSNVIKVVFGNKAQFIARPSGTEPKIKFYLHSVGKSAEAANEKIQNMKNIISNIIETTP